MGAPPAALGDRAWSQALARPCACQAELGPGPSCVISSAPPSPRAEGETEARQTTRPAQAASPGWGASPGSRLLAQSHTATLTAQRPPVTTRVACTPHSHTPTTSSEPLKTPHAAGIAPGRGQSLAGRRCGVSGAQEQPRRPPSHHLRIPPTTDVRLAVCKVGHVGATLVTCSPPACPPRRDDPPFHLPLPEVHPESDVDGAAVERKLELSSPPRGPWESEHGDGRTVAPRSGRRLLRAEGPPPALRTKHGTQRVRKTFTASSPREGASLGSLRRVTGDAERELGSRWGFDTQWASHAATSAHAWEGARS